MEINAEFSMFGNRLFFPVKLFVLSLAICVLPSLFAPIPQEPLPEHLKHFGGLFVRVGNDIKNAPPEDVEVAQRYPRSSSKGALVNGNRITILTAKSRYRVNEPVRIIHVHEVAAPGQRVYVMGPAPIYHEFVDGIQVTPDPPMVRGYAGMVVRSPEANYNYEITEYCFTEPGRHTIQWRDRDLRSNLLTVVVKR